MMRRHTPPPSVGRVPTANENTVARGGYLSGVKLLVADTRMTLMLLNEARGRTMERVFGVPRDQSGLLTIIALAAVAEAFRTRTNQARSAAKPPSVSDSLLGVALVRESMQGIAGVQSRDLPLGSSLIALGMLGGALHPAVRASARRLASASHKARAEFDHRYGHLILPNRRRRRSSGNP